VSLTLLVLHRVPHVAHPTRSSTSLILSDDAPILHGKPSINVFTKRTRGREPAGRAQSLDAVARRLYAYRTPIYAHACAHAYAALVAAPLPPPPAEPAVSLACCQPPSSAPCRHGRSTDACPVCQHMHMHMHKERFIMTCVYTQVINLSVHTGHDKRSGSQPGIRPHSLPAEARTPDRWGQARTEPEPSLNRLYSREERVRTPRQLRGQHSHRPRWLVGSRLGSRVKSGLKYTPPNPTPPAAAHLTPHPQLTAHNKKQKKRAVAVPFAPRLALPPDGSSLDGRADPTLDVASSLISTPGWEPRPYAGRGRLPSGLSLSSASSIS